MIVPVYLPYFVLAGAVGVIATLLFGLRSALGNAGWTTHDRTVTAGAATIIVIGWFFLAIALASADAFRGAADRIPTIQYGIFVPILIGGLLIWRSPRVARIIDAVPQHWLVGVQLYRALGGIFLILYATGKLPGAFAWPAGIGDVLTGVLAPVVAIAYWRGPRENADLVLGWNLFGLADLVDAVTVGMLSTPSPFQLFAFDLPSELISRFPLVLVPVFLVPLLFLLHVASLTKLYRAALQRQPPSRNWASSGVIPGCSRRKDSTVDVGSGPGKSARAAPAFRRSNSRSKFSARPLPPQLGDLFWPGKSPGIRLPHGFVDFEIVLLGNA